MKKKYVGLIAGLITPITVKAHCPLCTIGAAGAAAGAAYLGVSVGPIGVFIGAFAAAIGLWIDRILKKKYVPGQKTLLVLASFATTILPLRVMLTEYRALYLPIGEYGKTFAVDAFLVGSLLGLLCMLAAPKLSKSITQIIGKKFPYQGIAAVFSTVVLAAILMQILL